MLFGFRYTVKYVLPITRLEDDAITSVRLEKYVTHLRIAQKL